MNNTILYIKANIKPKEEHFEEKGTKLERLWKLLKIKRVLLSKEVVETESKYRLFADEDEIDVIVWDYGQLMEEKLTIEWMETLKQKAAERFEAGFDICYSLEVLYCLSKCKNEYSLPFLKHIFRQLSEIEVIYMKDEAFEEIREFAESIYEDCNKMVIWLSNEEESGEQRQSWEELADYFYENTGLAIEVLKSLPSPILLEKDKWKKRQKTVYFDFSPSEQIPYRQLPQNTIYIDFYPNKRKKRILTVKRSDVTYLTYANFLDINAQNTV